MLPPNNNSYSNNGSNSSNNVNHLPLNYDNPYYATNQTVPVFSVQPPGTRLSPPQPPPEPPVQLNIIHEGQIDFTQPKQVIIDHFFAYIEDQINKCQKSYIYYTILYHLLLFPVALLSLSVSIIAFLISADLFNVNTDRYLSIVIGIIGILVTAGHSTINYLEFNLKRNNFSLIKNMFSKLEEKINFSDITNLSKTDFAAKIERELDKIQRYRNYQYPFFIVSRKNARTF